ncbi:hypothetical protein B5F76_02375 [Desulfovibrio sp. An276]|uniref:EH signature domain-containing protein n=1 Tax=Desulfovibrio sp. An276 TaxID=1965618 RepID=UPI000B38B849|nr:hypothetical protein B5F76_02375 [Desulfovibrio sp. An276]
MLENFSFPALQIVDIATEQTGLFFDKLSHKLEGMCKNMGKGALFQKRKTELINAAQNRRSVRAVMKSPNYIRPIIDLWTSDLAFCRAAPPGSELLGHISFLAGTTPRRRLTRLALRELCVLFFVRYDELPGTGLMGQMLVRQLSLYNPSELMYGLDKLIDCKQLFNENGHEYLASIVLNSNRTVLDVAQSYGIPTDNSCFVQRTMQAYYIKKLESLPVNANDPLLDEVRKRELCNQYVNSSLRLGHRVMQILIDKLSAERQKPNELWMDTILAIGGDPRVPMAANGLWWGELKEEQKQRMIEWLSEMDLRIFLQICRDYVAGSDREDLARMYPARELFLNGLFKKKVIRSTRLFLGYNVQQFVARSLQGKNPPYSTRISDASDLAIFYLDLGNAHIVEGSFSFTIKIMDRVPPKSVLTGYHIQIHSRQLRTMLQIQYEEAFPASTNLTSLRHDPRGKWKKKAVMALRSLGVPIVDSDVISSEEFARMW